MTQRPLALSRGCGALAARRRDAKKRCTALFRWMATLVHLGDPSKIFLVETSFVLAGRSRAPSLQEIAIAANDQSCQFG
jgi:hypothetical protein